MLVALDSSGLPLHPPTATVQQDEPSAPATLTDADVQRYCSDYKQDHARLWVDKYPTAEHRFPNLAAANGGGGKVMMDFNLGVYATDLRKVVKYFQHGERTLFRSHINDRDEESTRLEYKGRILSRGLNLHGRSKAIGIPPDHSTDKASDRRALLAAAHTAEAFYLAREEAPDNVQVVATEQNGLEMIDLHQDTPEDIQRFFVYCMNQDNGGSEFNPQQLINERERLQQRWEAHRTTPGSEISVRSCGGPAQYEAYHRQWLRVAKCPHFSLNWGLYSDLGVYLNSLKTTGKLTEFQNVLKRYFNNVSRPMTLDAMFRNLKYANDMIIANYTTTMSATRFDQFWWELAKCCMPLHHVSEHMCCLQAHDGPAQKMVSSLAISMSAGRVVAMKFKAPTKVKVPAKEGKGEKKTHKAAQEGAPKKRRKLTKKTSQEEVDASQAQEAAKDAKEAEDTKEAEEEALQTVQLNQSLKDLQFLDDVSQVIDAGATRLIAYGLEPNKAIPSCVHRCIRAAIILGLSKSVQFNGTSYNLWSKLKQALFKHVAEESEKICQGHVKLQQEDQYVLSVVFTYCHSHLCSCLCFFVYACVT